MLFDYSFYNIIIKEDDKFVYLYNSYSGAFCKLEKEVHSYIFKNTLDDNNKINYFDELLNQGFIKPTTLNEYNRIVLTERISVLSRPQGHLSYVIAPTLACNLNCEYCFESKYRNTQIIDDNKLREIADYILSRTSKNIKDIHIGWFGGEPLIAYEQILRFSKYIIPKLHELNIEYHSSMISNGLLFTQSRAKYLAHNCALKRIQITIDGTEKVYCAKKHATSKQFATLFNNIKNSLDFVKISIRLNCDENNYEDLKNVTKQLLEYCSFHKNLTFYLAKLVDYKGSCKDQCLSQQDFDHKRLDFEKYVCTLRNQHYTPNKLNYRKTFCELFKVNNQVIGPLGEIYKCEHHVGQEDKIIGDISYGLNYSDFFIKFITNEPPKQCRECKIFPICLGGCPAQKNDLPIGESCYYSEYYLKGIMDTILSDRY